MYERTGAAKPADGRPLNDRWATFAFSIGGSALNSLEHVGHSGTEGVKAIAFARDQLTTQGHLQVVCSRTMPYVSPQLTTEPVHPAGPRDPFQRPRVDDKCTAAAPACLSDSPTVAKYRQAQQQPTSKARSPQIRRIPAPALLPPVVSTTHSTLSLSLDSRVSTLQRQVEDLLAKHRVPPAQTAAGSPFSAGPTDTAIVVTAEPGSGAPPLPPKDSPFPDIATSSSSAASPPSGRTARSLLPPNHPLPRSPELPALEAASMDPQRTPATYGPSTSRMRSTPGTSFPRDRLPAGAALYPSYGQQQTPGQLPFDGQHEYLKEFAVPKNTVARSYAKGGNSILLHKGFYDLLALSSPSPDVLSRPSAGWTGDASNTNGKRAVTLESRPTAPLHNHAPTESRSKPAKRINVGMIGQPQGFMWVVLSQVESPQVVPECSEAERDVLRHLVHASDAEQAEALLTRWLPDGNGKLGEPAWAVAIKEAARARARARGIAQVQANLDEELRKDQRILKVVNANTESLVSTLAPSDSGRDASHPLLTPVSRLADVSHSQLPRDAPDSPSELECRRNEFDDAIIIHEDRPAIPIQPPPQLRPDYARTFVVRDPQELRAIQKPLEETEQDEAPLSRDVQARRRPAVHTTPPASNDEQQIDGRLFRPSLETVEKSVATKIYLENHYYAILKRPRDRDQRLAALERELAAASIADSQRRALRAAWALSETEHLRDLRSRVSASAFVKLKTIGHGAFGVVSLVRERATGEVYAMKQLRKADMLRKGQEGHVRAERDVMSAAAASATSRWIVQLVYSFQDTDHLYLVMEYMGGGDLLNLLIERDIFDEDFARFYIAEMVLAIQEAHKLGYIHRDIKPDNFIFSSNGHIKLSDFGLATDFHWAHDGAYYEQQRQHLLKKHGIDLPDGPIRAKDPLLDSFGIDFTDVLLGDNDEERRGVLTWREKQRKRLAYSVVGTNSYMSPEVIRGTGYDQACDWWSLGIILFECLYGYPPFVSKSRQVTRQKILTWRQSLRFPSRPRISLQAQDLIQRLLCEREDRLGSRPNKSVLRGPGGRQLAFTGTLSGLFALQDGADDIKAHKWFRGMDFETIHLQTPPFKPDLQDASDTRYFDDDIAPEPLAPPDAQPGQADQAKDPLLRDRIHGAHLLDVRKQLAFQGYTFKSPKRTVLDPRSGSANLQAKFSGHDASRGRSAVREASSGFRRAMSL